MTFELSSFPASLNATIRSATMYSIQCNQIVAGCYHEQSHYHRQPDQGSRVRTTPQGVSVCTFRGLPRPYKRGRTSEHSRLRPGRELCSFVQGPQGGYRGISSRSTTTITDKDAILPRLSPTMWNSCRLRAKAPAARRGCRMYRRRRTTRAFLATSRMILSLWTMNRCRFDLEWRKAYDEQQR